MNWQRWLRRVDREANLERELSFHIEERVVDIMRSGVREEDARRRVRLEFGAAEQVKDECRDVRPARWAEMFVQDVRYACRNLRRNPGFAAVAIAALTLGIGASSAIFSVIYGVLFKPLPYRDPERLLRIYQNNLVEGLQKFPLSPADFLDYRQQNHVFQDIATYVRQDQQFGGERPERLVGLRVSHGYFRLFGFEPLLGRTFAQSEESNSSLEDSAIISYNVWQRLMGGDPHVIGKTIRLTDYPFHVVGVMPREFEHVSGGYREPSEAVGVWLPYNGLGSPRGVSRAFHFCTTVARLKPSVTLEQAQSEMNLISQGLEAQHPDDKNWRIELKSLREDLAGKARPTLLILAGAVAFVLLIACVNVANLLLARATAREREMAIRSAVGATRFRLVGQMLTESLTLASIGGALGLVLAWGSVCALVALGPEQVPRLHSIALDVRVVVVTVALSLAAGLLFGLAPALAASTNLRTAARPRGIYVIAEVALTFVLLTGAGLLLRSFLALGRIDPGFNPRGVLTMNTSLSYPKLIGAHRYAAFYQRFLENLARIPSVTATGSSSNLPWSGGADEALFGIEGRPRPANLSMHAHYQFVSPDYLRTIGVPLLVGRWLESSDHFDAPKVVVINQTLALRYWPSAVASVGQRIYTMRDSSTPGPPMTIVGVTNDVKDSPTDTQAQAVLYQPFLQSPSFGNYVALRATADPATLISAVRQVAQQMGNDLSIQEIRPLEQVVAAAASTERFALQIVGLFAVVALVLALIGIYGVMSYAAGHRAHEIAIRTALGAKPIDTVRVLVGPAVRWIAAGLIVGGLVAAELARVLTSILYQVSPGDPMTFMAVPVILAAVAVIACYSPARRALRIDPIEALRHE